LTAPCPGDFVADDCAGIPFQVEKRIGDAIVIPVVLRCETRNIIDVEALDIEDGSGRKFPAAFGLSKRVGLLEAQQRV